MMKQRLLTIRFLLIPQGSRREIIYRTFRQMLSVFRHSGFRAVVEKIPWWLDSLFRTGARPHGHLINPILYRRWMKTHEPGRRELARQRKQAESFPYKPLVTIVTPVYNPDPGVLGDTIESVRRQTYPNWELCLADGDSDRTGVRDVLDRYAHQDARIKVQHLTQNLGIAGNSNAALAMGRGEYVALLDHDDLLAPDMLFEVVRRINQEPDIDIIYFDEDKISADKKRRSYPWFKPGAWSPDLMLSTNYLMHSVIRRTLVDELGGFDPAMDGAQDWDLALRLTEKKWKLAHIPRIFYHWRQVPGSAAGDANAKPWAFAAQERCILAHLERLGVQGASIDFPSLGLVHIRWPLSGNKVSIIIPTRDKVEVLRACLSSILEKTTYPDYEIILIDNGSVEPQTRDYFASLAAESRLRIFQYDKPYNFHKINNFGARQASGDVFVFLNNDTEVLEPAWLEELVGWAERPEIGVLGAKLLRPDGSIQHAGILMGVEGHGSHAFEGANEQYYGPFGSTEWYRNYQAVTGACMAIRRSVFESLGGFDETYQVGYGDIDLCLRAFDAGYRVVYTPFARVLHHEGASRGLFNPPSDVLRATIMMYERVMAGDGFFNPNLSNKHRLPTIARPRESPRDWTLMGILVDFDLVTGNEANPNLLDRWRPMTSPSVRHATSKASVLMVTHELTRTGAPITLSKVAHYLIEDGYRVKMLSPVDGPMRQSFEESGLDIRIVPALFRDSRVILDHLGDHDLLLANTILSYRTIFAARAFRKPSLFWVHESQFGVDLIRTNPAIRQALVGADAVLFPCEYTKSLYREYDAFGRHHSILIGVDPDPMTLQFCKETIQDQNDKIKVIQIGSVEPRKGQDVLIKSVASLPSEISENLEFDLVGQLLDKGFHRKISRMARRLDNLHILGELSPEEVSRRLAQADIYILPSRDEALPRAMIEAMAYGKAIVATDVGGIPEVINDGMNGLLVANEDTQALSQQLIRLFNSRELREELGRNAQKDYQERLNFTKFASQIRQLVDQLIEDHSKEY